VLYGFFKYAKDVHTEHCCLKHGCKYGDTDCPVELGIKRQSFACEWCYEEGITTPITPSIVEVIRVEACKWAAEMVEKKKAIENITADDFRTRVK
jgi:hypothetical protein